MIPSKKDPNLSEYTPQLQILNRFSDFIYTSKELDTVIKDDARRVIESLKFIKVNLDFIGYAVEHRSDDAIYTFAQDKSKGVIRDFNNTAMHFNSYSSSKLVQTGLKNLVAQFEQSIEAMQEKGELDAFAKKLQFDEDIGCIEARTAAALSFAATRLSTAVHSLDDRMQAFYSNLQNETNPNIIITKAMAFFKPWMGQHAIWGNTEYTINSALIKRYFIEILVVDLPTEIILEELKKKESSPHHVALIESINPQQLAQAFSTSEYGLKFLEIVSLNQPSEIVLALLHKIDNETIKTLFHKNSVFFKTEFVKILLKSHSAAVCETLFEKLTTKEISHFEPNFKEMLKQCFKKAIQLHSFIIFDKIKDLLNFIADNRFKFGLVCFTVLSFGFLFLPTIGFLVGLAILASCIVFPLLALDFIRVFIHTPINACYKNYHLTENLLNDILALQSTRVLALFFSNLSAKQLKTLNFPLIKLQERLPDFLFASNLFVTPETEDIFYQYWYSNSALRALLINNNYSVLAQCINAYFEAKLPRPHPKMILLFEECLTEMAKKQVLSAKEQAFLKNIKQEEQSFPPKSLEEIWLSGVESWDYYRHLRLKRDLSTEILLDRLVLKDELFGGSWNNEIFTEYLNNFQLKQEKEQQAFEKAKSCIEANSGLAKVIEPNYWGFFMRQLENPSHRESSLRRSVTVTEATKKFVHLTGEVIPYQKDRHPKPKAHYSHTKKTSTTLLSPKLLTMLYNSNGGFLFDRRQCQIKAWLLSNARTYEHEWVGNGATADAYKTSIQNINETNEERFLAKIQNSRTMNEVLAKLNKEALRAIVIQNNTPAERLRTIRRRNEIESKFSVRLPILFYKPAQKSLKLYTLTEQARDQLYNEKNKIRGNRLWINH